MKELIKTLTFVGCTSALLSACGPDLNSRYGDAHWDPQSTWDKAEVVSQPELSVAYKEIGVDSGVYEAYVSIDFNEVALLSEQSAFLSYSVGSSEALPLDASMLQSGASSTDTQFYYDTTTDTDYRLRLTEVENYTFAMKLFVRQPNGTLRKYDYQWRDVIVPGSLTRNVYWDNRVNAIVTENCRVCHNAGDAAAAFSLASTTSSTRRTALVNEILTPTLGKELPGYPFSDAHYGSANLANTLSDADRAEFETFVNAIVAAGVADDIEIKNLAKPAVMEMSPY